MPESINRGHKGTIKCRVKRPEKWCEIEAMIYGKYLAIHKNLDGFHHGHVITHIPTGYVLRSFRNLQTARAVAIKLANLDMPWEELTVKNAEGEVGQRVCTAIWKAIEETQ